MFISIDSEKKTALLEEPNVLTEFHIQSPINDEDYVASVIGNGSEAAGDAHVWISIEWISQNVTNVSSDWGERFSGMVQYAMGKGWVSDPGTHLKAHIEVD
tara:strand:- start:294 stop:596 length:303 start_codon:yes stop_codon:yes gene_type:complete